MRGRRDSGGLVEPAVPTNDLQTKPGGLVAKVRHRLFPARLADTHPDDTVPHLEAKKGVFSRMELPRRTVNFQASIAEFFLVNRLRARSQQSKQAAEILERASHIVFVTCKHWFAEEDQKPGRHETRL